MLCPHPKEALVVRGIFENAANGLSTKIIVERLAAAGHRTRLRQWGSPQGEPRTVGGCDFRADTVRAVLRNSIYAGRIRFSNHDYPGIHEALVTNELWEKANLAANNAESASRMRQSYGEASSDRDEAESSTGGARKYSHAIHRALAWQLLRAKQPSQTTAEFAKSVEMSVATVDFHFRLLKLDPEIQAYLLKLTDRVAIRRFGLMRLLGLVGLEASAQRAQFAAMRIQSRQDERIGVPATARATDSIR